MSTTLSLFDELTHQTRDGYPVTALLTQLLQTVAHDVCLSKRNLHSAYWTVSRVRDVLDEINALVARAGEGDSWAVFDKYTSMILWVEQILLDFSLLAEKESRSANLPGGDSIQIDLDFIDTWRHNRKDMRETVRQLLDCGYLGGDPAANLAGIKAIHRHDDSTYFKVISQRLLHLTTTISGAAKGHLATIHKQLEGIQTAIGLASDTLPDDVIVYSTQTAMIIEIVASARDKQIAGHLQSPELWSKISSLVTVVDRHARDVTLLPAALAAAWNDFCSYLTSGVTVQLPDSYKALRTLVSQIRRPYYGQSLALISGCVQLAPIFGNQKTRDMLSPLKIAIDRTTTALGVAAGITYDPTVPFFDNPKVSDALDTAKESIKECFQHYTLEPATFEQKFVKARDDDHNRLISLQNRFKSAKAALPATQQKVILVVSMPDHANPTRSATQTYSVEATMTLSTVLWKETMRTPERANRLRSKGYFHAGTDKLSLDAEIGSITERNGRRSVSLSIAP